MLKIDNYFQKRLGQFYDSVYEGFLCIGDSESVYLRSDQQNIQNNAFLKIQSVFCGADSADENCATDEEMSDYWS